jgi:hypothetical protein
MRSAVTVENRDAGCISPHLRKAPHRWASHGRKPKGEGQNPHPNVAEQEWGWDRTVSATLGWGTRIRHPGSECSYCRLRMSFHSIQQHWHLLDDLDVESFERGDFSGMVGQEANSAQIQIGEDLRSDADLALGLALALR